MWKRVPLTFRRSFISSLTVPTEQTDLLLAQKRIIEEIAKSGRDSVIVGRNADILLAAYAPFNIFVCADIHARINRCMERADAAEHLSAREIERNITRIDKARSHTRAMISGSQWGDRKNYHLVINTTEWGIKELTPAVAEFITQWYRRTT